MSELKIVVSGPGCVGKSSLTVQFTSNQFVEQYDPTIEEYYKRQVQVDGEVAMLDILDTAGQEEYSCMREQYYLNGNGFVLVFSVVDRNTFTSMSDFRDEITKVKEGDKFPLVLVGNKVDLQEYRMVKKEEAEALASKFTCPYIETSAKNRVNVEECFHNVVREIRKKQPSTTKKKDKKGCSIL